MFRQIQLRARSPDILKVPYPFPADIGNARHLFLQKMKGLAPFIPNLAQEYDDGHFNLFMSQTF